MSGRHVLIWIWEREGESNQKRAGRQLWLAPRRRSLSISSGPSDLVGFPLGLAASQLLALLLGLPSSARPPAAVASNSSLVISAAPARARSAESFAASASAFITPISSPCLDSNHKSYSQSPPSPSHQVPKQVEHPSMAGGKSSGNAARSRKRVEATVLKRSRDGSAFTRW